MTRHSLFRYFKTYAEIIRLAAMLYVRFPLSRRNADDLLHERGIDMSRETVRYWWQRFRPRFACRWRSHLDEIFVKINGERHYLREAVGHGGEVPESFFTSSVICTVQ